MTALNLVSAESGLGFGEPAPQDGEAPRGAFAPAVIVLMTDGENTDPPDPLEAAQTAIDRGVRVYAVGFGTEAGAVLEVDGLQSLHTAKRARPAGDRVYSPRASNFRIEDPRGRAVCIRGA